MNLFSGMDSETIVLGLLLLIFLAIINYGLNRSLKDKTTAGIISICAALLITYGIYKSGWDIVGFIYGLGIGENFVRTILPLIVLGGLIWFAIKKGVRNILIALGLVCILASILNLVYETKWVFYAGVIMLVLGIILRLLHGKKFKGPKWPEGRGPKPGKPPKDSGGDNNPDIEKKKREIRIRSKRELQKKYGAYSKYVQALCNKTIKDSSGNIVKRAGRIPSTKSKNSEEIRDGRLYHRYRQAMETCQKMSRRQGLGDLR